MRPPASLPDLERAVGLIQGEFLAGFSLNEEPFEDWLRQQRRRFEVAGTGALETFARRCDEMGKGPQAIATVERLLALDPLREDWQRLALQLYARHRGQGEAMAQAKAFTDLLQRELDVAPEPQTQALIQEIRQGAFAPQFAALQAQAVEANRAAPQIVATPADIAAGAEDLTARLDAAPAALGPARGWAGLRQWPSRGMAAVALTAASILLVGFAALMIGRSASPPAVAVSAKPPPADPWRSPRQPATGKMLIPVLVLPFKTYGDAGSTQLLADMMSDDLINMLSRVPGLRVISRETSRSYQGEPIDVAAIGTELQVRYILEASMRMHGGKLRVNVELIDPATRLAVWSGRIERDSADQRGVQDEIVGRLARELHFEVIAIEGKRRARDDDAEALAYRGHAALRAAFKQSSAEAFKVAETLFKQALERDPHNVSAQVGLGGFHANIGAQRPRQRQPRAPRQGAARSCRRSSGAIPRIALRTSIWDLRTAHVADLRVRSKRSELAVELNPSNAGAHAHFGHALAQMGRATEGLEHIRYAMRLSPRDPSRAYWFEFECNAQMELGRYQEAIESCRRSAALNPRLSAQLGRAGGGLCVGRQHG